MAVYYGDDDGGYAAHASGPNYPSYHSPADNNSRQPLPYYGNVAYYQNNNASATSLRPDYRDGYYYDERRGRHRSLPPPERGNRRRRERSPPPPRDPIRRAQSSIKDTFTNSTSGVSVGVLGAIIGGLVAREASGAAAASSSSSSSSKHKNTHHNSSSSSKPNPNAAERTRLVSTLVGAAVGGFGANALEKRIEVARERTAEKEEAWEKKWGKDLRGRPRNRGYYDDDDGEEDRGRRRSQRRDVHAR